MIKGIIPRIFT